MTASNLGLPGLVRLFLLKVTLLRLGDCESVVFSADNVEVNSLPTFLRLAIGTSSYL